MKNEGNRLPPPLRVARTPFLEQLALLIDVLCGGGGGDGQHPHPLHAARGVDGEVKGVEYSNGNGDGERSTGLDPPTLTLPEILIRPGFGVSFWGRKKTNEAQRSPRWLCPPFAPFGPLWWRL